MCSSDQRCVNLRIGNKEYIGYDSQYLLVIGKDDNEIKSFAFKINNFSINLTRKNELKYISRGRPLAMFCIETEKSQSPI